MDEQRVGQNGQSQFVPRPLRRTLSGVTLALFGLTVAGPASAAADLVLVPHWPTLIALVVFFLILVLATNTLIFRPIFQALDERVKRVEGARERAEELDAQSDALLDRYQSSIRDARAEAESNRKNKLGHAREEQIGMTEAARAQAEAKVEEARAGLEAALVAAREGLRASSSEIARAVAARVIGRDL